MSASIDTQCIDTNLETGRYISRVGLEGLSLSRYVDFKFPSPRAQAIAACTGTVVRHKQASTVGKPWTKQASKPVARERGRGG